MKVKKMTKKQLTKVRVDNIKDRMKTDDKFLFQCMLKIFSFQTSWEKQDDTTQVWNDVGFSGVDGEFLSSVSNQYIKKGYLSDKQMVYVKKRMIKYAGQIDRMECANVLYLDGSQLLIPLIAEKHFKDYDIVVLDQVRKKKEYVPYERYGGKSSWESRQQTAFPPRQMVLGG